MSELATGLSLAATVFSASLAAHYEYDGRIAVSIVFTAIAVVAGILFAKSLVLLLGGAP